MIVRAEDLCAVWYKTQGGSKLTPRSIFDPANKYHLGDLNLFERLTAEELLDTRRYQPLLAEKLIAARGSAVFYHGAEPLIKAICCDGEFLAAADAKLLKMPANSCHENSLKLYSEDLGRYSLFTGLALTDDDESWRYHSWVCEGVSTASQHSVRVIETTSVRRRSYYGLRCSDEHIRRWIEFAYPDVVK